MSESPSKPMILAVGAAGSLLLAISSRRSKRKAAAERRERCREAQEAAQIILAETSRQGAANRNQNGSQQGRENSINGHRLGIGGTPLLLHGLLSLILLYTLPLWQPFSVYLQSNYQEFVALALLATLTLHILIAFLSPSFFASSRQRQVPPPIAAATTISRPETILNLNGVWTKDKEASDSMDPVCDLMQLNRLMRVAIGLIKGVEIIADPNDSFQLNVLSGIMWFKIKEKFSLNGEEARHRRRDFRGGKNFCFFEKIAVTVVIFLKIW
jgi:hypothetical protein